MSLRVLLVCAFAWRVPAVYGQPTYAREVARILQAKCQQCHRAGDIAPMELASYAQAADWAQDIKRVISEGIMPPWKPVEGHGKFRDSYGLTDQEKQDLLAWIDGGTPLGDEADMPEALPARGEWSLGEPHKVVQMAESYRPLRGRDIYRCFVMDPQLDEDKYVSAIDVLPGNRKSVHHVIAYLDTTGKAEQLDAADPDPGYSCVGGPGTFDDVSLTTLTDISSISLTLGGWAPGARPHLLPEGVGMFLSKRAKIILQVHYYTNVSVEPDQTRLGLYFTPQKADRWLVFFPMVQTRLNIPAGDPAAKATYSFTLLPGMDAKIINVFPHMHLLGRDIKVEATRGGKTEPLIWINNWDFNWQGSYTYESEVAVPALTRLSMTCTYDNSVNNPRNPSNPPKNVRWGEGTEDEMCVAFLGMTFDLQSRLGLSPRK